jgi:hypothetical protein
MRFAIVCLGVIALLAPLGLEAAEVSDSCNPYYQQLPEPSKNVIIGVIQRSLLSGEERITSGKHKINAIKINDCDVRLQVFSNDEYVSPVCNEILTVCTKEPISAQTDNSNDANVNDNQDSLQGKLSQNDSRSPLEDFRGDYPGETFQQNKEKRVRENSQSNPVPDEEPSGEFTEYLICIKKDADEMPVIKDLEEEGSITMRKLDLPFDNVFRVKIKKENKNRFLDRMLSLIHI